MAEVTALFADLTVIGIDPGPVPGIVRLDYHLWGKGGWEEGRHWSTWKSPCVVQCDWWSAPELIEAIARARGRKTVLAIERYVLSNRSVRNSDAEANRITRELITTLRDSWQDRAVTFLERSASQVKPWATADNSARLKAAKLWDATEGMRHARSAAWHALYAAVHDGGIPDPLSKKNTVTYAEREAK